MYFSGLSLFVFSDMSAASGLTGKLYVANVLCRRIGCASPADGVAASWDAAEAYVAALARLKSVSWLLVTARAVTSARWGS